MKKHDYKTSLKWTGNTGKGTSSYRTYKRDHVIQVNGKPEIRGSSDPSFMGSPDRYNPEELLVGSLAACHMLWYLHVCSVHKVVVVNYRDEATGVMIEEDNGSGKFESVTLYPQVIIASSDNIEKAKKLHKEANKMCFIANSCAFPVYHKATIHAE